jgi:hypothetical protein
MKRKRYTEEQIAYTLRPHEAGIASPFSTSVSRRLDRDNAPPLTIFFIGNGLCPYRLKLIS